MQYVLSMFISLCYTLAFSYNAQALDPLNESLVYHTYFGKVEEIQKLLVKGADPNTRDEHYWPVLAIAADRSDEQSYPIAKALIEAGAELDIGHQRNYPLINAIRNRNVPLIRLLVSQGANLMVKDSDGNSALSLARETRNHEIIDPLEKQLLEEEQTQIFLRSARHLWQITQQYAFHNCAFQYWGYYLQSNQDADMDENAVKDKIQYHARKIAALGRRALRYFPTTYRSKFDRIASDERQKITRELDDMISNRNRRRKGVGSLQDQLKRCGIEQSPLHYQNSLVPRSYR